jgi:DNA modification methylase
VNPYWQLNGSKLYQGHSLDALTGLEAGSVQLCVTSPPY